LTVKNSAHPEWTL